MKPKVILEGPGSCDEGKGKDGWSSRVEMKLMATMEGPLTSYQNTVVSLTFC